MSYLQYPKKRCEVWFVKYYSKYQNGNKVVDISTLLPCWSVVKSKRVNPFAAICKRCLEASFKLPSIIDLGWNQNANIWWIKEPFPKDIEEILISIKYNENDVNDEEDKTENEGDTF